MARKQTKVKMTKLWLAPGIAAQVEELIEADFPHLADAKVVCAFSAGQLRMFGRLTGVRTDVVGGKVAALAQGLPERQTIEAREVQFFLLTVNKAWWDGAKPDQRLERLDTALCRCDVNDKGGLGLRAPDFIGFRDVVRRRGLPTLELKLMARVVQTALPGLDEAEEGEKRQEEAARAGLLNTMGAEEAAALVAESARDCEVEGCGRTADGSTPHGAWFCSRHRAEVDVLAEQLEPVAAEMLTDEQAALDAEPSQAAPTDSEAATEQNYRERRSKRYRLAQEAAAREAAAATPGAA